MDDTGFDDIRMGDPVNPARAREQQQQRPRPPPQQQQQQQQDEEMLLPGLGENPDQGDPDDAAGLEKKMDLTDDKIDWNAVYAEDLERAKQVTVDKKWNADTFFDSKRREPNIEWCFACRFRHQGFKHTGVLDHLNEYITANYGHVKMLALLTSLREMFITDWLARMKIQNTDVKFWFRRTIYEHLHEHNRTEYVFAFMRKKQCDVIMEELWAARKREDPILGVSTPNTKVIPMLFKTGDKSAAINNEITKMRQRGIEKSF